MSAKDLVEKDVHLLSNTDDEMTHDLAIYVWLNSKIKIERLNSLESDSVLELEGSDLEDFLADLEVYNKIDKSR